jgi:hypothetical protein
VQQQEALLTQGSGRLSLKSGFSFEPYPERLLADYLQHNVVKPGDRPRHQGVNAGDIAESGLGLCLRILRHEGLRYLFLGWLDHIAEHLCSYACSGSVSNSVAIQGTDITLCDFDLRCHDLPLLYAYTVYLFSVNRSALFCCRWCIAELTG